MTLNLLQLEMVHCTLLQASEWESVICLWCVGVCALRVDYMWVVVHLLRQSLAGVVHVKCVAPWVVEGSKGITSLWHCSCSLQTSIRRAHIGVERN